MKEKLEYVSDKIGEEVDSQNPDQMTEKLEELSGFTGYCAGLVSEAERAYKMATLDAYKKTMEDKPPSTVHSKVLEGMVAEEAALYTYADKINSALRVRIDSLRTMISLFKMEMESSTR